MLERATELVLESGHLREPKVINTSFKGLRRVDKQDIEKQAMYRKVVSPRKFVSR
jgi:hypothetical protein